MRGPYHMELCCRLLTTAVVASLWLTSAPGAAGEDSREPARVHAVRVVPTANGTRVMMEIPSGQMTSGPLGLR